MLKEAVNRANIVSDRLTWGNWTDRNLEYFGNPMYAHAFWQAIAPRMSQAPRCCELVEFGSADGFLGEYVKTKMYAQGMDPRLTLIDAVASHLQANRSQNTQKVQANLMQLPMSGCFDVGLARSITHYFSTTELANALHCMKRAMRSGGQIFFQVFIQEHQDLGLFRELNQSVGKNLNLLSLDQLVEQMQQVGFSQVDYLQTLPTWHCSSTNLQLRYQLDDRCVDDMRQQIWSTSAEYRNGFAVNSVDFSVPVPYRLIVATV